MRVRDIYGFIDKNAPFSTAAEWDNSGLLVGDFSNEVKKVMVCLDVTTDAIEFAKNNGADLLISHHPVIFKPMASFVNGNIAYEAAINGISIICAHTNLDKSVGGVNDTLCDALGLDYVKQPFDIVEGFLNTAELTEPMSAEVLARLVAEKLGTTVDFCDADSLISKVAVCSGSGADFISDAKALGCDGFITGEASYHKFLDAKASGISLFAAGHFETEVIIVKKLVQMLRNEFCDIDICEYTVSSITKLVK